MGGTLIFVLGEVPIPVNSPGPPTATSSRLLLVRRGILPPFCKKRQQGPIFGFCLAGAEKPTPKLIMKIQDTAAGQNKGNGDEPKTRPVSGSLSPCPYPPPAT